MNRYSRYTYRAKRIDNNEWIFGVPYYSEGLWWILVDDSHSTTKTGTGSNNINIETLCQCTGLQDIDGKDIFENDIVELNNIEFRVDYSYGSFEFSHDCDIDKNCDDADYIKPIDYKVDECKIIGNKFDKEED